MSALGQKRTLFMLPLYVCFAPESGHLNVCAEGRIYEHTPSLREGSHRPVCRASRINIIFTHAHFKIPSIALAAAASAPSIRCP
jgi:hypothetical protein